MYLYSATSCLCVHMANLWPLSLFYQYARVRRDKPVQTHIVELSQKEMYQKDSMIRWFPHCFTLLLGHFPTQWLVMRMVKNGSHQRRNQKPRERLRELLQKGRRKPLQRELQNPRKQKYQKYLMLLKWLKIISGGHNANRQQSPQHKALSAWKTQKHVSRLEWREKKMKTKS